MRGADAEGAATNIWVHAARPRTLPAAVVPVLVGSAQALQVGSFDWRAFTLAMIGALSIQVAANFANDASDAARGADTIHRVGPTRMVASGRIRARQMWIAAMLAIGVGGVCGIGLTLLAGPLVLVIGVASVAAMLGYVGGPMPYGYRGLGEVFVFIFFGLVATAGSRYVHDRVVEPVVWLLAVPVGLLCAGILVVNNLRDLDTDAATGKRTLAVILGPERTRVLFTGIVLGSLALIGLLAATSVFSPWTALALLGLPLAVRLVRTVFRASGPHALIPALGGTAFLHLLVGLLLAAGTWRGE
jgi:1,4-dihydroxy-2-naphthoate octaprenyltransferase